MNRLEKEQSLEAHGLIEHEDLRNEQPENEITENAEFSELSRIHYVALGVPKWIKLERSASPHLVHDLEHIFCLPDAVLMEYGPKTGHNYGSTSDRDDLLQNHPENHIEYR